MTMVQKDIITDRLQAIPKVADIVFVNCPHFNVQFPNSGIAYLCEALRDAGYEPAVFDFNILLLHKYKTTGLTEYWEESKSDFLWHREGGYKEMKGIFDADIRAVAEGLAAHPVKILGFSVNLMNERCTEDLVQRIKKIAPDKKIIFGGYSYYHEDLATEISTEPELVVVGDGEESIVACINYLLKGKPINGQPGIMVRGDAKTLLPPTFTQDVDEITWPRWRDFHMDDYTFLYPTLHVPVHPSRGCGWGRCTFCSASPTNPGYRHRSAKSIFDEIKYLHETFGAAGIFLTTLQVNGDYEKLGALCDLMIEARIKVQPYGQFTIHKGMTLEVCKKLHKAGFIFITFGLESGSDAVLKMMKKGYNKKIAANVLRNCHAAGIITSVNLIIGYPGETEEHFEETCRFLKENREIIDQVEVTPTLNIQFGSGMWSEPEKFGIRFEPEEGNFIVNNWESLDGKSNLDTRSDRHTRIVKFVNDIGIGRGYAKQELDFSDGHVKEFSENIFTSIVDPECDKYLPSGHKRVLIMRSSLHEHVISMLSILEKRKPDLEIDMLLQADCIELYEERIGEKNIIVYDESRFFSKYEIGKTKLQKLKDADYDTIILFYGQMSKGSYNSVIALAKAINSRQLIGIDMRGDFEVEILDDAAPERQLQNADKII